MLDKVETNDTQVQLDLAQVIHNLPNIIRGLENKPYQEMLKELGMLSLEKRRLARGMVALFKHEKGCLMEEGTNLQDGRFQDVKREF